MFKRHPVITNPILRFSARHWTFHEELVRDLGPTRILLQRLNIMLITEIHYWNTIFEAFGKRSQNSGLNSPALEILNKSPCRQSEH